MKKYKAHQIAFVDNKSKTLKCKKCGLAIGWLFRIADYDNELYCTHCLWEKGVVRWDDLRAAHQDYLDQEQMMG